MHKPARQVEQTLSQLFYQHFCCNQVQSYRVNNLYVSPLFHVEVSQEFKHHLFAFHWPAFISRFEFRFISQHQLSMQRIWGITDNFTLLCGDRRQKPIFSCHDSKFQQLPIELHFTTALVAIFIVETRNAHCIWVTN